MLKRILLAVIVLSFYSTSVFAQDEQVFVTFGEGANVSSSATVAFGAGAELSSSAIADVTAAVSGSAFIYSAGDFRYDAFDLSFSTADDSVIRFTGAEVFNPINNIGDVRWGGDESVVREFVNDADGRLIGVALPGTGVNPGFALAGLESSEGFDPATGFFRVARIDYDIVGIGEADITLAAGPNQFFAFGNPDVVFTPTFGNGALTVVGVPEPSTVGLLALGLVGFVARRRR